MFTLMLLIAIKGALIGGHIAKSEVSHGMQSGGQVIVESILSSSSSSSPEDGTSELYRSLAFYPPNIDFGSWSIGTARSHIVTLVNKNTNRSVYLSSISGKTPVFYSSFFEDKVVPPQGNTTFNVVFLPRNYGKVETNLFIHTSFGQAKLPVKGEGRECPYRLRSLVGIKAPLNATIRPEIYMYNPHAKPIQILEVYSSGGQFQLELPSGGQEGPQTLWEIPPYTSKPIIRIRFHGIQPGNHSAYIRIKISSSGGGGTKNDSSTHSEMIDDVLVIPVDVEILTSRGIYSPNPYIDFGKVASSETMKIMKIDLFNSGDDHISIIDYELKILSDNKKLIKLQETDLTLQLNPRNVIKNYTKLNGELIIKSQNKQTPNQLYELSIDINAEIYKGSLEYQKNTTVFITGAKNYTKNEIREFYVKNLYNIPIAITNLTIDNNDTNIFKLIEFQSKILLPGEKLRLFKISAINETANFISPLKIQTNLTTVELSLIVCTGLLKRYTSIDPNNLLKLPNESVLDFGIVPFGDFSNFGFILMTNPNPIPIQLIKWDFTNPRGVYYQSIFMGCAKKTDFITSSQLSSSSSDIKSIKKSLPEKFNLCLNLSSSEIAAFELAVQSFNIKSFTGVFKVWTEIEEVATTVKFVTVMGRLEIDQSRLHFSDCFPGKRCSADISIQSTFLKTMRVSSITVSVPGLVFEYHTQNGLPEITANSITDIGRIHFDPKSVCGTKCYIPQEEIDTEDTVLSSRKSAGAEGGGANLDFDETELRKRTELYRHFKWSLQKITFTLNTSEIRLFEFNSTVDIIWPKLVKGIQILPPIEVGQIYDGVILINNPSSKPIRIHLSLSDPKRAKSTSISLPLEVVEICVYCYLTDENVFHLNDNAEHIIDANSFIAVKIRFIGKEAGVYSTLLHLKNNLTLYEAVWITGKSVQPQFRFGNRKPGSQTPLLFEVSEKQLTTACETSYISSSGSGNSRKTKLDNGGMITIKRTFTARNTGEVPILIETFQIGDRYCEGYGFKIIDCTSFELKSNTSKKIDIIFTPDFTMTRITQHLQLKTNLSYNVNYTLLAIIPYSYLEQCSIQLQRPVWETHMKRMFVGMLSIAFMFVLIAAFFDSVKVLTDHVQNMSTREKRPLQPPLDLRNIGLKTTITTAGTTAGGSGGDTIKSTTGTTFSSDDNYSSFNGSEKHSFKNHSITGNVNTTMNNTVKKRNSKRSNYLQQTSPTTTRDKSWAEELARKLNSNSKCSADAQLNNNNSMHANHHQITSSSGYASSVCNSSRSQQHNSMASSKLAKEEKQPQQQQLSTASSSNKKSSRDSRETAANDSSACMAEKNFDLSSSSSSSSSDHRKNDIKIETNQTIEVKKPKLAFKKTKSTHTTAASINAIQSDHKDISNVEITQSQQCNIADKQERTPSKLFKEKQKDKFELPSQTEKRNPTGTSLQQSIASTTSVQQSTSSPLNFQNEHSISPPMKPNTIMNQRKYGKTPGRERKKEQQNTSSKRNERKQITNKYKNNCNAFQFSSPILQNSSQYHHQASAIPSNNIWDQNQISFSHVVAQNIPNGGGGGGAGLDNMKLAQTILNAKNYFHEQQQKNQHHHHHYPSSVVSSNQEMSNIEHDWNEADLKNHETFGNDLESKRNSVDLGPIGTRKSPSLTPIWEPLSPVLTSISNPSPPPSAAAAAAAAATNSSFFSSNFPIGNNNNYEYTTDNQYLGGASGLLDHILLENQHQRRWDTNNVLLSLLQQSSAPSTVNNSGGSGLLRQHQAVGDWQTENRLWTPMGYQDEPNSGAGSSLMSDQMNVWQRNTASPSTVRPPPGLGLPKPQPQQQQQQQHHHHQQQQQQEDKNAMINNQQQQQQQHTHHPTHSSLLTTPMSTSAPAMSTTTTQPTQNPERRTTAQPNQIDAQMQPFDPFSALNSIWTSSWHKNNSSNNNNTNQQ